MVFLLFFFFLTSLFRRNFKAISTPAICLAINAEALSKVFALDDVETIHNVIADEIVAALDIVAPTKSIQMKERRTPLYLSAETLTAIKERDHAAVISNHDNYRKCRNRAARLVRKDKLASNVEHLRKGSFNPEAIWHLANTTSGRTSRSSLPTELTEENSGSPIRVDDNLADCLNRFYIDKICKIRSKIDLERGEGELEEQEQDQQQLLQQ